VPEADQKQQSRARNQRAGNCRSGDLGQYDVSITGEAESEGYRGKSDEPAADTVNFLSVLSGEDDAMISGGRNQQNDRDNETGEAGGMEQLRTRWQLLKRLG